MAAIDAEMFGTGIPGDRSTASAPRGGYLLNPLWLLVLAAGAFATWRLYEAASTGGGRRSFRRAVGSGRSASRTTTAATPTACQE
jgi:hypothetical protein